MGKKVAKLVRITLTTRVIVDETADDQEIINLANSRFVDQINNNEAFENIESIKEDTEVPFDIDDAVRFALNELKGTHIEGDVRNIIQNRACELLGDDYTDDGFEEAWERLH